MGFYSALTSFISQDSIFVFLDKTALTVLPFFLFYHMMDMVFTNIMAAIITGSMSEYLRMFSDILQRGVTFNVSTDKNDDRGKSIYFNFHFCASVDGRQCFPTALHCC